MEDVIVKAFSEVTFSHQGGDDEPDRKIKISKGEESNFIWSIFYSLLEQVISILNVPEDAGRETDQFNQLQYVFIDDPVTSLDENHLIEIAVNLADVIKESQSDSVCACDFCDQSSWKQCFWIYGTKVRKIKK